MPFSLRLKLAMGQPCPYCRKPMNGRQATHPDFPTRDHVNPRVRGGGPTLIVCQACNGDKDDLSLERWAYKLRRRNDPRAETVTHLVNAMEQGRVRIVAQMMVTEKSDPAEAIGLRWGT